MPRFSFECECGIQFSKTLKMGAHEFHPCPDCYSDAKRLYEGFGFGFAAPQGAAPGNTGVAKHDYPTADQAVGSSAEARWQEIQAREKVKTQVREHGSTRALIRRHGAEESKPFVEYEAGSKTLLDGRKQLVASINKITKDQGDQ